MKTIIKNIVYPTPELFDTIKSFYLGLQLGEHMFESNRDITDQQAKLMFKEYQKTCQKDPNFEYYMAFSPLSPVRIRTTSSTGDMKIFPSPMQPV